MRKATNEDIVEEYIRIWRRRNKKISMVYSSNVAQLLSELSDCYIVGI